MPKNLPADRLYMAIGYNAWGRGKTKQEAINNWKKNAYGTGGKQVEIHIYDVPDGAYVNEMGQITRPKDSAPAVPITKVKVTI